MHSWLLFLLPVLSSVVSAVEITSPDHKTSVVAGEKTKVTWTHVEEDPDELSLYLVNFVDFPPSYVPLAIDIDTEDDAHKVHIPCETRPSSGYQINAINGTNIYIIYAQSAEFTITPAHKKEECMHEEAARK